MFQIKGSIKGVAPILFNKFTEQEKSNLKSGRAGGKRTDDQRITEAMTKVYKNERGIYLPKWNFKKCILLGCQKAGLKERKAGLAPFLEATVFLEDDIYFGTDKPDFLHEHLGRVPPRTGAAVMIRRPAMNPGWGCDFVLNVVDDLRDAESIKIALETAGQIVGLGSWRPEYGRFIVTAWDMVRA